MSQKVVSKPDPMQVESVAGSTQCIGSVQDSGVWAVKHVVVVIWKGRTFGLLGQILVATIVGEKGISPRIVPQKRFGKRKLSRERG